MQNIQNKNQLRYHAQGPIRYVAVQAPAVAVKPQAHTHVMHLQTFQNNTKTSCDITRRDPPGTWYFSPPVVVVTKQTHMKHVVKHKSAAMSNKKRPTRYVVVLAPVCAVGCVRVPIDSNHSPRTRKNHTDPPGTW